MKDAISLCMHMYVSDACGINDNGCFIEQIDPSKSMDDFFHGEPSVLNFLIQRNIISKVC